MTAADGLTTWRDELAAARQANGDTTPIAGVAPSADVLDEAFDDGFGRAYGPDVLIWTATHVYFPVTYDGAESLGSAPRNPRREPQHHVGGE